MTKKIRNLFFLLFLLGQVLFAKEEKDSLSESLSAKKLNVDNDKFFVNLEKYGNTSAASIPMAFCEAFESKKITKGDKVILVGFGGGLTWGSTIIEI